VGRGGNAASEKRDVNEIVVPEWYPGGEYARRNQGKCLQHRVGQYIDVNLKDVALSKVCKMQKLDLFITLSSRKFTITSWSRRVR